MSQKIRILGLSLLAFCLLGIAGSNALGVNLVEGKYEVIVVISPAMSYDGNENLIDDIKDMMMEASAYLHIALKGQAIFGKVIILIPSSWPDDLADTPSEGETFAGGDIYIGDRVGCGACASPGRIEIDISLMDGDTVVHEWGHYRFGLGDEYCDYVWKYSDWYQVYKTTAGWNRCTALQEIVKDCEERAISDPPCATTEENVNGAKASIMHQQFNLGIDSFCDDSEDEKYKHNSEVNNHHNRIWSRRSCWSVIEAHSDGFSYSGGTVIPYEDPVFEVKKASKADVMLVIDVSGSMGNYSRIDNASQAARSYIYRSEEGCYVGIVQFDDTATLVEGLTEITDEYTSRRDLADKVPETDTGGWTSIGAGMRIAKDELNVSTTGHSKVMLLLTDGDENEEPWIATVLPEIIASNIKVYCVGLAAASSSQLQDIADSTGGVYYFALDEDIQALNEAFTSVANLTASIPGNTVVSEKKSVSQGTSTPFDALIDSPLGQNTIFTFSGLPSEIEDIDISLRQPDESILDSSYVGYSKNEVLGVIMFRIEGIAQNGYWIVTATNNTSSDADVIMELTSSPVPEAVAVTLTASVSKASVAFPEPIAIQASLISSESIIGAHVWAEVMDPFGQMALVTLSDNGQGADKFPLDGVYSGFFTEYIGDGRYSVKVFADNIEMTAQLGAQFKDGPLIQSDREIGAMFPEEFLISDDSGMVSRQMSDPTAQLGFDFERVISAGAFELTGYIAGDYISPAKVLTLSVISIGQDPPSIVLGWIAPGDDMDNGQATSYDLRYSTSPILSDAHFGNADPAIGIDPPMPAGEDEQFTFLNLNCNTDYYFALKAVDDEDNQSEMSNVISALIDDVIPPIPDLSELPEVRGQCKAEITLTPTATDNCNGTIYGMSLDPLRYEEQGTYTVTWSYIDNNANSVRQTQTVIVEDTIPPVIEKIVATPDILRPPNHKMVPVTLSVSVSDNCDKAPFCQIISVSSNEPENGLGDGDMAPDWEITGNLTVNLRAERSGKGSGRVYTITVMCTDYAGNSSEEQTTVTVPHDKKKK